MTRQTSSGRDAAVFLLSFVALIGGSAVSLADDTAAYETPPIVSAADILPAELLNGEHHRVDEEVRSDGYLNYYAIRSDYGDLAPASTTMLRIRIRELAALAQLDEISKTEVFVKGAADAGIGQLRTIKEFATSPIETVTGIPAGIGRLFTRYKRQAGDGLEAAKETLKEGEASDGENEGIGAGDITGAARSVTNRYFDVSAAERRWHRELGTDPYTSNATLQNAVKSVAWADRLGRFGIQQAGIPKIPGMSVLKDVNEAVWSNDPYELQDLNRERLRATGADDALIDAYLDDAAFSPSLQTYLTGAIAELDGVDGRAGILAQALNARSETEARFFVESVLMLAWYHRNEQAIVAVTTEMTIPIGLRAGGSTIALLPADRVYWTESIAQTAGRYSMSRGGSEDQTHDLWLTGTVSERGRRNLARLGWDVRENIEILSEL